MAAHNLRGFAQPTEIMQPLVSINPRFTATVIDHETVVLLDGIEYEVLEGTGATRLVDRLRDGPQPVEALLGLHPEIPANEVLETLEALIQDGILTVFAENMSHDVVTLASVLGDRKSVV